MAHRQKHQIIQPQITIPIPEKYADKGYVRLCKIAVFFNVLSQHNVFNLDNEKLYEFAAYFEALCYAMYVQEMYPAEPIHHSEIKSDENGVKYHGFVDLIASRLQEHSLNIFKRIIEGEIKAEDLFGMQIADLQPEKAIKIQKIINETTKGLEVRYIKGYTCSNCKEQKMIPSLSNHRSIDEGSVTKLTCATCGKFRYL